MGDESGATNADTDVGDSMRDSKPVTPTAGTVTASSLGGPRSDCESDPVEAAEDWCDMRRGDVDGTSTTDAAVAWTGRCRELSSWE